VSGDDLASRKLTAHHVARRFDWLRDGESGFDLHLRAWRGGIEGERLTRCRVPRVPRPSITVVNAGPKKPYSSLDASDERTTAVGRVAQSTRVYWDIGLPSSTTTIGRTGRGAASAIAQYGVDHAVFTGFIV